MRRKGDNSGRKCSLILKVKLGPTWAARRAHADVRVERCIPGRFSDMGLSKCAPNVSSGGHVVRPREYPHRCPTRLLCYCAAPFCKGYMTHIARTKYAHGAFLAGPASRSCSVAYQPQGKVSNSRSLSGQCTNRNIPSARSRLAGRSGTREPKVAHKHRETRYLDTQTRNEPRNVSDVMRSCKTFEGLR